MMRDVSEKWVSGGSGSEPGAEDYPTRHGATIRETLIFGDLGARWLIQNLLKLWLIQAIMSVLQKDPAGGGQGLALLDYAATSPARMAKRTSPATS